MLLPIGVLVQKMAPAGHEVIVGMINDETFDPIMIVGFGGIAIELYQDVAYWPAPHCCAEISGFAGVER